MRLLIQSVVAILALAQIGDCVATQPPFVIGAAIEERPQCSPIDPPPSSSERRFAGAVWQPGAPEERSPSRVTDA